MREYHVGLAKRGRTLEIEARRSVDFLSCELYDYLGLRLTTKASLYKNRYAILAQVKRSRPEVYGDLRYAIVT